LLVRPADPMSASNKTRKTLLVIIATAACALLAFADLKKGEYAPSQLGSLQQSAPPQLAPDANFAVSAYPAPAVDLAPGDGVQEVRIYCNTCHTPRYITMQPPLPPSAWEAEVNKMNKAFGANIPEEESHKIVVYLQAHYSVGNRQ
jgi:sulfite dehydrogenase (cytochrome) subunit B